MEKLMYPTYWAKTEKIKANIFNKLTYVKGDIPSTRFVILFNLYTTYRTSYSISYYNDKETCFNECNELDIIYKDHALPVILDHKWNGVYPKNKHIYNIYDFTENKSWWGYIVLDFELKEIIRVGGYGFLIACKFQYDKLRQVSGIFKLKGANIPEIRDYFFRDVDQVPDDYVFECEEEYKGWLQFKWGDGKNAIDYVEPPKSKKPKIEEICFDFETAGLDDFPKPDDYEIELIENKFSDMIDKETQKRLMDKFGW